MQKSFFKNSKNFKKLNENNINMYFLILNSNKFIEYLILKLNKNFFGTKVIKKYDKKYDNLILAVSTNISNFFILKKYISFELSKEKFKFQLFSVEIKNNKMSVEFFQNNFLNFSFKEEKIVDDVLYLNYVNAVVINIFLIKIFLLIYYLFFNTFNIFKYTFIFYNNVYNTSSC